MIMLLLVYAHALGDIIFQPDRYASKKTSVLRYMVIHCYIYAGTVSIALWMLGYFAWWKPFAIFISHYLIDTYLADDNDIYKLGKSGWYDQLAHILILIGVAVC